jgi:hypothetical protein
MTRNINALTTGEMVKMLVVAPRTVCDWIDDGTLKGWRVGGSKDRRTNLKTLIEFRDKYNFPTPPSLRLIEECGLSEEELEQYNITEPIGTGNIHFYPEKYEILTNGDMAGLLNFDPITASRWMDKKKLGYRPPYKGKDRRISADDVLRAVITDMGEMAISSELESKTSLSINYQGRWGESQRIMQNSDNESVWYRSNRNIQEISIRCKDDGLYIKLENGTYDLILLGMTGREEVGKVVHLDHIDKIASHLRRACELLADYEGPAKKVIGKAEVEFSRYRGVI